MFTYKTVRLLSITAALAMAAPTARIVAAQQPAETSMKSKQEDGRKGVILFKKLNSLSPFLLFDLAASPRFST